MKIARRILFKPFAGVIITAIATKDFPDKPKRAAIIPIDRVRDDKILCTN